MEKKTKQKITKYIVYKSTLRELVEQEENNNQVGYRQEKPLYLYEMNMDKIPVEQKIWQQRCGYLARESRTLTIGVTEIRNAVKREMMDAVVNGYTGSIEEYVTDKILDGEVMSILYFTPTGNTEEGVHTFWYTEFFVDGKRLYVDDREKEQEEEKAEYEYVEPSKEELDKLFSKVKVEVPDYVKPNNGNVQYIGLELMRLNGNLWSFRDKYTEIRQAISKTLRENLTYCVKKGKVIVPKEYLDKGEAGIEEWRTIKQSKNKSNNMEKKMLNGMLRDKREQFRKLLQYTERSLTTYKEWSKPYILVDGTWNVTRNKKLLTSMIKDKSKQELLSMSEEDMLNATKEYWLKEIELAKKGIEELTLENFKG